MMPTGYLLFSTYTALYICFCIAGLSIVTNVVIQTCNNQLLEARMSTLCLDNFLSPSVFCSSSFAIGDKSIHICIYFSPLLGIILIFSGSVLVTSWFLEGFYLCIYILVVHLLFMLLYY